MSGAGASSIEQPADVDAATVQQLVERVEQLEQDRDSLKETVEEQQSRIDDLEAERDGLQQRVSQLEAERDGLQQRVSQLEAERDGLQQRVSQLETELDEQPEIELRGNSGGIEALWIAGMPLGKTVENVDRRQKKLTKVITGTSRSAVDFNEITSQYDALVEGLGEARAMREKYLTDKQEFKSEFANLRRQLRHVSEETDVELLNAIPGDDKVAKVVKDGVASVIDGRVNASHERAEKLLHNLDEWATVRRDDQRTYATYTSATAKDKLETARSESLQTTQVKRTFEKIASWAESSPRFCRVDKNKQGRWRIRIGVSVGEGR
ncbi:hypothetical protein D3D02_16315 [Halobellus sp. Atlit-38R]|nr:hypothetical protein D3D02_16315 [Halobellus sp. Atlit-38R]